MFAIARQLDDQIALVVLNFADSEVKFSIPREEPIQLSLVKLILSNYSEVDDSSEGSTLLLRPYEAQLYVGRF